MAKKESLRARRRISMKQLEAVNELLLDPKSRVVKKFLTVVGKYGTPEETNAKAAGAGKLESLMARLEGEKSPYLGEVKWLMAQRDAKAFISVAEYRKSILGDRALKMKFKDRFAVNLEISADQYFPWVIEEAKQAIAKRELMPGGFIRVRKMRE